MKYIATSFCLTLGAWRVRLSLDVEDAPDDRTAVVHHVHALHESERKRERA